ncbi:MAG: hypothetical protein R6V23_06015 [Bacteroidales bacterium]
MNHLDFYKYINQPALLKHADIEDLRRTTKDFPYFQAAHVLLLLAMKIQENDDFENQLTQSSVHLPNRDLIYHLLNKDYEEISQQDEPGKKTENIDILNEQEAAKSFENDLEITEQKEKDTNSDDKKLLKNRNVRRKIKDSAEGMGENISETILSQIEFSVVKDDDELEYSPEIYFMDDERTGKNNVITIDARPGKISEFKNKDILQIDESEEISDNKDHHKTTEKNAEGHTLDLSGNEKDGEEEKQNPARKEIKKSEYFDINNYADEDEIIQNADENDLIARFIAEKPRIEPKEVPQNQEDISEDSTHEDDDLLTETLIKVYIAQGYLGKAIKSYEKLSLKYPEKSSYFANQIKILKEKINHK